jgi:hypothetical protein
LCAIHNHTDATASSAFSKSSAPTFLCPIPDDGSNGLVGEQAGVPAARRASVNASSGKNARTLAVLFFFERLLNRWQRDIKARFSSARNRNGTISICSRSLPDGAALVIE